ncbi:acireductone dioxygenase [Litorivivens sp.]|uniref:1,2-dihydroxy-3-keto-5-methylthiopentene dioxygenase n=1 Tax=Litorivivens sp. TaxID=2020868 RepID=UPI0035682535
MSQLKVFADSQPNKVELHSNNQQEIAAVLKAVGVRFEQWQAGAAVVAGDSQEKVLAAYQDDVKRLLDEEGYQTVDVISLKADNPDKDVLRKKFLSEHIHTEDEVRFFVDGKGLFSLHIDDKVYEVLCEKGDLISVPANTRHWFDMGPEPHLVALRFFNNPDGWVAHYSGSEIADQFSRLEA